MKNPPFGGLFSVGCKPILPLTRISVRVIQSLQSENLYCFLIMSAHMDIATYQDCTKFLAITSLGPP